MAKAKARGRGGKGKGPVIGPTAVNRIRTETKQKKYCRFKRAGIKYIDYKDPDFLLKFVNEPYPASPHHRNQPEVPAPPFYGYQARSSPGTFTLHH